MNSCLENTHTAALSAHKTNKKDNRLQASLQEQHQTARLVKSVMVK